MKLKTVLVLATLISFLSSVAIIISDTSPVWLSQSWSLLTTMGRSTSHSTTEGLGAETIADYINQKGRSDWISQISFATLLDLPQVLGTTDTKPESEVSLFALEKLPEQKKYTVAFLGDSMIDTLGEDLQDLANILDEAYPALEFELVNYGAGAITIETGLTYLTEDHTYLGKARKAVLTNPPDIVVVESFAYNHWENSQSDLDRQWLTIAKIIDTVKAHSSTTRVILAATIAPFCPTYTAGSADLPPERRQRQCEAVKAYLQNMVNFATSQNYPLINAYQASLVGTEGDPTFIDKGGHIHPSGEGRKLFAAETAKVIASLLP